MRLFTVLLVCFICAVFGLLLYKIYNNKTVVAPPVAPPAENKDCVGQWTPCDEECNKTWNITQPQSGTGNPCVNEQGTTQGCSEEDDRSNCTFEDCATKSFHMMEKCGGSWDGPMSQMGGDSWVCDENCKYYVDYMSKNCAVSMDSMEKLAPNDKTVFNNIKNLCNDVTLLSSEPNLDCVTTDISCVGNLNKEKRVTRHPTGTGSSCPADVGFTSCECIEADTGIESLISTCQDMEAGDTCHSDCQTAWNDLKNPDNSQGCHVTEATTIKYRVDGDENLYHFMEATCNGESTTTPPATGGGTECPQLEDALAQVPSCTLLTECSPECLTEWDTLKNRDRTDKCYVTESTPITYSNNENFFVVMEDKCTSDTRGTVPAMQAAQQDSPSHGDAGYTPVPGSTSGECTGEFSQIFDRIRACQQSGDANAPPPLCSDECQNQWDTLKNPNNSQGCYVTASTSMLHGQAPDGGNFFDLMEASCNGESTTQPATSESTECVDTDTGIDSLTTPCTDLWGNVCSHACQTAWNSLKNPDNSQGCYVTEDTRIMNGEETLYNRMERRCPGESTQPATRRECGNYDAAVFAMFTSKIAAGHLHNCARDCTTPACKLAWNSLKNPGDGGQGCSVTEDTPIMYGAVTQTLYDVMEASCNG